MGHGYKTCVGFIYFIITEMLFCVNGKVPEGRKVTCAQDNAETQLIDVMAEKSPISPPTSRSPILPTETLRMKYQKTHVGSPTLTLGESAKPEEVQPAKVELQKDRGIVENLHI